LITIGGGRQRYRRRFDSLWAGYPLYPCLQKHCRAVLFANTGARYALPGWCVWGTHVHEPCRRAVFTVSVNRRPWTRLVCTDHYYWHALTDVAHLVAVWSWQWNLSATALDCSSLEEDSPTSAAITAAGRTANSRAAWSTLLSSSADVRSACF